MTSATLYPDYRAGKDRLRRMAQDAKADGELIRAGQHPTLSMHDVHALFFFHPCLMGRNLDALILGAQGDAVNPVLAIVDMRYAPQLIFGPATADVPAAMEAAHDMLAQAYALILENRIDIDMTPVSRIRFLAGGWIEIPNIEIERIAGSAEPLDPFGEVVELNRIRERSMQLVDPDQGQIDEWHPHADEMRGLAAMALHHNLGPLI